MTASSFVVSLGRHLTGLSLPLNGLTGKNRRQLDLKTEKAPLLSPNRSTLTNKRQSSQNLTNQHKNIFVKVISLPFNRIFSHTSRKFG